MSFFRPGVIREVLAHLIHLGCVQVQEQPVQRPRLFALQPSRATFYSLHPEWMARLSADALVRESFRRPDIARWRTERKWAYARRGLKA